MKVFVVLLHSGEMGESTVLLGVFASERDATQAVLENAEADGYEESDYAVRECVLGVLIDPADQVIE